MAGHVAVFVARDSLVEGTDVVPPAIPVRHLGWYLHVVLVCRSACTTCMYTHTHSQT